MNTSTTTLFPPELEQRFAQIGCQDTNSDPLVLCRLFIPGMAASWYLLEYDPVDKGFLGWANLYGEEHYWELGYIDLNELQSLKIPKFIQLFNGLYEIVFQVHRDLTFSEKPISQVEALPPHCVQVHAEAARRAETEAG